MPNGNCKKIASKQSFAFPFTRLISTGRFFKRIENISLPQKKYFLQKSIFVVGLLFCKLLELYT